MDESQSEVQSENGRFHTAKLLVKGTLYLIAVISIFLLWLMGAKWVSEEFFTWVNAVAILDLVANLIVFVPMMIFRKTRGWGALCLYISSYVFGLDCWMFSFLVTFETLGAFWLVVGLILGGVGVFPLALIGCLIDRRWDYMVYAVLAFVITVAARTIPFKVLSPPETN